MSGNPDGLKVGDVFRLNFGTPRLGLGYVVRDLDTFLRHESARIGQMKYWYVADLDWRFDETNCLYGEKYLALQSLIASLELAAAMFDRSAALLVFLRDGRVDLPIHYSQADLVQLDVDLVKKITTFAGAEDGHAKQRAEILGTAVVDLLKNVPESDRFAYLLRNLGKLFDLFRDGYSLFVASFSYEKVRDQIEGWRVEHTAKIHKAISDIQGQLLGIPVSTIIVATQLKEVSGPGAAMWGNIAVLVGVAVFVVLLGLAIRNQFHSLDILRIEVDRHESATKKECATIAPRFSEVYGTLRDRISNQIWILLIIGLLAVGGFFLAFIMFFAMTQPALAVFWS